MKIKGDRTEEGNQLIFLSRPSVSSIAAIKVKFRGDKFNLKGGA